MSNRKFITVLSLTVLIILLVSRVYFGIENFNQHQQLLEYNYKYGNLFSYMADSKELVGLDARNAKAKAPLLSPGMSVNDIEIIDVIPGNHSLVNVGIDEVIFLLNGEKVTIAPDMKYDCYLDNSSTIYIQQGFVLVL